MCIEADGGVEHGEIFADSLFMTLCVFSPLVSAVNETRPEYCSKLKVP